MFSRTKIAAIFTLIYLVGVALVVWFKGVNPFGLELNNLGDFVAGAFGPLALAWLIFGYLQQGEELRQSTFALKVQGDELKKSVEQQQRLAEISMESLAMEKAMRVSQETMYRNSLRPILALGESYPVWANNLFVAECDLFNDGAQIFGVEAYATKDGTRRSAGKHRTIEKGGSVKINIIWDPDAGTGDLLVDVLYSELDSTSGVARFKAIEGEEPGSVLFVKDEGFSS